MMPRSGSGYGGNLRMRGPPQSRPRGSRASSSAKRQTLTKTGCVRAYLCVLVHAAALTRTQPTSTQPLSPSTHSPTLSPLQDGDFMPAEDEPYYSRRPRTAALSHHARSADIEHATGSLSYGSNVRERSMIWQLAPQHGQSTRALTTAAAYRSRPRRSYTAAPTRSQPACSGLPTLWAIEEAPHLSAAEEGPRWRSHATCPRSPTLTACAHPAQAGLSWLPCSLKHEQRECTASDPFEVHPLNSPLAHTLSTHPQHTPLAHTLSTHP